MSNATDTPCNAPHGNGVSGRRLQFKHHGVMMIARTPSENISSLFMPILIQVPFT
jgi:hypothetical protein